MHACVNIHFPSPSAWQHRHAWPRTRITPGDRMGTHTYANITGTWCGGTMQGAECYQDGHNRRMWLYCFNPPGNGARAAKGECLGLIHVTKLMTDGSKSWTNSCGSGPKPWTLTSHCGPHTGMLSWHNTVMKGQGNGYENDLNWKGVAEICATQVPVFFSTIAPV